MDSVVCKCLTLYCQHKFGSLSVFIVGDHVFRIASSLGIKADGSARTSVIGYRRMLQ